MPLLDSVIIREAVRTNGLVFFSLRATGPPLPSRRLTRNWRLQKVGLNSHLNPLNEITTIHPTCGGSEANQLNIGCSKMHITPV
jgi:hypothetical protein